MITCRPSPLRGSQFCDKMAYSGVLLVAFEKPLLESEVFKLFSEKSTVVLHLLPRQAWGALRKLFTKPLTQVAAHPSNIDEFQNRNFP